jgi:uncharacterized protein YacL
VDNDILQVKDGDMKVLTLFLRIMLIVLLLFLLLSMGVRLLKASIQFWYLSIPVLILLYLLVSGYWKNKKAKDDFLRTPFHPSREVKPTKEPEVTNDPAGKEDDK